MTVEHKCGGSEGCMCVYDPACNWDLKWSALTAADHEAIERIAHQLRVALTVVDRGGYGTWRGNAERALAEAERRGLVSAHTPTVVRTEGV